MPLAKHNAITVCRYCMREDHPDIRHALTFGVYCGPDNWEGETVCLWPCNHEVHDRWEPRCVHCTPLTAEECTLAEAPF